MCCPTCDEFIEMYDEDDGEGGKKKKARVRVRD
ncbi:MAG: hypothetical protein MAG715_01186 [Methanonatronarchaeales archaeon]|nr:hypothetical protein [Methanonatronarchaeales archaeon]